MKILLCSAGGSMNFGAAIGRELVRLAHICELNSEPFEIVVEATGASIYNLAEQQANLFGETNSLTYEELATIFDNLRPPKIEPGNMTDDEPQERPLVPRSVGSVLRSQARPRKSGRRRL